MTKFLGTGGAAALAATFFFMLGSSGEALAQVQQQLPGAEAVIANIAPNVSIPFRLPPTAVLPAPAPAPAPTLSALVDANSTTDVLDAQAQCLATAVYFESMGESLEGQLAVANVVINRAASGRYPASWCGVVKQKAQFSFVRAGRFPRIDAGCAAWRKAQAIARIAANNIATALPSDVLWYHADYVSPSWGRRLTRVEKIGAHIFYRV